MRNIGALLLVGASALATVLVTSGLRDVGSVTAAGTVPVSTDLSKVPRHPSVVLSPASPVGLPVGPSAAVTKAIDEYKLSRAQIDTSVGVVPAVVSLKGDNLHQNMPAWIVTAIELVPSPVTATIYQRRCIVISALTGRFAFSYLGDPERAFRAPKR